MTGIAVVPSTGEVVSTAVVPFDMGNYLADVGGPQHLAQQKKLAALYDAACQALIGENDVQKEGARTFKKKSAWRKLARHFLISTEIVKVEKEDLSGMFCATVTVRAVAPWGQYAEEVGACATDEATGRRTITTADAIATAATRATNRAVSNLIAMGEVSAEEIGDRKAYGSAAQPPQTAHAKKMPFGKHKGTPLGELDAEILQATISWCSSDDEKSAKFKDLIAACKEVLLDRSGGDDDAGGLNDPDDLPFG